MICVYHVRAMPAVGRQRVVGLVGEVITGHLGVPGERAEGLAHIRVRHVEGAAGRRVVPDPDERPLSGGQRVDGAAVRAEIDKVVPVGMVHRPVAQIGQIAVAEVRDQARAAGTGRPGRAGRDQRADGAASGRDRRPAGHVTSLRTANGSAAGRPTWLPQ